MRRLDRGDMYPAIADLADEPIWIEELSAGELADVLRSTLSEKYANSTDEEMADALDNVLDAMSPAEAFNFGAALNQIGKSASRLASDPAFVQIARTAVPIAGGALGTFIGGPLGTALGSKLGTLAANALPAAAPPATAQPPAPPPSAPTPAAATPAPAPLAAPARPVGAAEPATTTPAAPATSVAAAPFPGPAPAPADLPLPLSPASPVAGGSAAAAQGLVLMRQPEVKRAVLATALGQHGRQQVSGIPVAQLMALVSQVFGQAAADADELRYLEQTEAAEDIVPDDLPAGSARSLYIDLLGADNLELAEAPGWDGLD